MTDAATTDTKIRRCMTAAARTGRDAMDQFVLERLRWRRQLLTRVGHLRPAEDAEVGPCGWVHGDFQHLNLLRADGQVSAVLDWDRLGPKPVVAEVVRSATLLFGYADARVRRGPGGRVRCRLPLPSTAAGRGAG